MIVIAIIGILVAISVPNAMQYRKQAEFAALKADLNVFMNAQDAYYIAADKFFPENGTIDIPSGSERNIPELGFTFKKGHKHRFSLYGLNMKFGSWNFNYCYIMVYADEDYDKNGSKDVFYCLTFVLNGQLVNHRQFYQLS